MTEEVQKIDWLNIQSLDIDQVMAVLPHKYPFLFIDRICELTSGAPLSMGMSPDQLDKAKAGSRVRALKNVTINESQFVGHFPNRPVLPGVLSLEAMAQAAGFVSMPFFYVEFKGAIPRIDVALISCDGARFRRPIRPGDQMDIHVRVKSTRSGFWSFIGEIFVESKLAAEAEFMAQVSIKK